MYTEVYWAFNFLVNAVILWCACALCAVRQQPRLLAAAAFGAFFATAAQYLPLLTRFSLPAAAVMAFCCTGHIGFKRYVHFTAALYAMTFLIGGLGVCALGALGRNGVSPGKMAVAALVLTALAFVMAAMRRLIQLRALPFRALLRITGQTHAKIVQATIDSGNQLCDPLTLMPVIALSDPEICADLTDTGRQIRFESVGGGGSMRLLRARRIEISQNGRWIPMADAYFACPALPLRAFPTLVPAVLLHQSGAGLK